MSCGGGRKGTVMSFSFLLVQEFDPAGGLERLVPWALVILAVVVVARVAYMVARYRHRRRRERSYERLGGVAGRVDRGQGQGGATRRPRPQDKGRGR